MLMSLADSGVKEVSVLGPPGLNHYLASMRPYTFRDPMLVNPVETAESGTFEKVFEDEFVRVFAFPILPTPSPSETEQQPTVPSKRKSQDSSLPPKSPKRVARDNTDTAAGEASTRSRNTTLNWQHPSFDASSLTGKDADEWKAIVIRDMFPGVQEQTSRADNSGDASPTRGKPRGSRARWSRQHLPKFEGPRAISVAYLVLGPEIRGKFDPAKADALGVAKRDRGKLTKGETVTVTKDGVQTIVTPSMCMGHSETPTGLLVVDCPTPEYISSLPDLKSLETVRTVNPFVLGSVVHRTGPEVLSDSRYALWAKGVGTCECSHLVAGEDVSPNPVTFESSAYLSLTLSELDKEMFFTPQEDKPKFLLSQIKDLPENTQVLAVNHVTEMSPPKPPTLKPVPGANPGIYQRASSTQRNGQSVLTSEGQKDLFAKARDQAAQLQATRTMDPGPGGDFRVTTLGTGSALPSKYRNVISTVIQMPGYGSIMLDCGENTWAKLLTQRRQLSPAPSYPLYLVLNRITELCVREYHDLEDLGLDDENGVKIIQIEGPKNKGRRYSQDDSKPKPVLLDELKGLLGFTSVEAVPVRHRTPACFGLVARHESGWSFAYSGDTMPCDALVEAGKDITLLIHEASMADEEIEKAQEKGHSTIGQAIDVGRRMNAKHLLLTHFSQRYPKMPVIRSELTATALAFDYMTITTSDIWKVGCYVGALEHVFDGVGQDDDDEMVD
ncbi:hypothetical protein FRC09_006214 [Ceratobasidium sp. 395]|nr:hypothetical protein FRC09_006214 [Ceratobasidium sp. 395]